MKVNVYDIKRAIKKGDLEVFIQDNKIYLNDPQSGDCVKIMQFEHKDGIKWIEVDK